MIETSKATNHSQAYPASYWAATANTAVTFPPLSADTETDFVIVGAGFTGLAAAHQLSKRRADCLVLDANRVGWGASGRNGGMAVPRYKSTFPALAQKYGADTAISMYQTAHRAVDTLEAIIADCHIQCGFSRVGHITPVVSAHDLSRFEKDVRWLEQEVGDGAPRMIDAADTERRIGSRFYMGGYFEPRGAGIHPLNYCLGLASALVERGVRIAGCSPARAWRREGGAIVVETPAARVRARYLLIATNAYTDIEGFGDPLRRRIVPVVSSLLATAPLAKPLLSEIMPARNLVTDAKRLTNYFRISDDGRMIFGGRGGASNRESPRIYRRLAADMVRILPKLEGVPIAYRWSGRVAVTLDSLPRVGTLAHNVHYAMGYNGRGVALATLLGTKLASLACGENLDLPPLAGELKSIPFHGFRVPAKRTVITYYKLLDALGAKSPR